jgi:hypothetical protein
MAPANRAKREPERYPLALNTEDACGKGKRLTVIRQVARPVLAPADVGHVPHSKGDDAIRVRVVLGLGLDDHDGEVGLLLGEQVSKQNNGGVAVLLWILLAVRVHIVPGDLILHGL